jgi:hypothetical protein
MLRRRNGQCRTFVNVLRLAWEINGAETIRFQVTANDGRKMFINNWQFNNPPFGSTYVFNAALHALKKPMPPGDYGNLTNLTGVRGQNNDAPAAKIFDDHVIGRYRFPGGPLSAIYYDPSYGVTYTNEADFEQRAIAGYGSYIMITAPFAPPQMIVEPRFVPMSNIKFLFGE